MISITGNLQYINALKHWSLRYTLYHNTSQFKRNLGLPKIQRAAISVPSNIAEGMGRFPLKERLHFIEIAYGSLMEIMCQLEIAELLHYITTEELQAKENIIEEMAKMLIGLRKNFENKLTRGEN